MRFDTPSGEITLSNWFAFLLKKPASVAQLDARQTGDQAVAGLPPRSATFFREN